MTTFTGMGGHQSARSSTVEWLTPPELLAILGAFDLDPCAPLVQPWPTARTVFTRQDNGLIRDWHGRVWLNPPYTPKLIRPFMARMAAHNHGTALIFARTETQHFSRHVWPVCTALLFIAGRLDFLQPDGTPKLREDGKAPANAGAPTVLCAYGDDDAEVLSEAVGPIEFAGKRVIWPEGKIPGTFVPLRLRPMVLVAALNDQTWREALAAFFAEQDGPVDLATIYRAFAGHPKAASNDNVQAKIRQQLQRGPYRRVERGLWEKAS